MALEYVGSAIGSINSIPPITATVVFFVTIAFLISLQSILNRIYKHAERFQKLEICYKIQQQLIALGLISFSLFILDEFVIESNYLTHVLPSLNLAHIVVLSIAVAFLIQTFLLIQYVSHCNKAIVKYMNISVYDLKVDFEALSPSAIRHFIYVPEILRGFGLVHPLKTAIDMQLFSRFFASIHDLDPGFSFQKYVSNIYQEFTLELAELSPVGWFLAGILAIGNFIRVRVIHVQTPSSYSCHHDDDNAGLHLLSGGFSCSEYDILCFACVCGYAGAAALLFHYYKSCSYYQSFVKLAMSTLKTESVSMYKSYEHSVDTFAKSEDLVFEKTMDKRVFQMKMTAEDKTQKWTKGDSFDEKYAEVFADIAMEEHLDDMKKSQSLVDKAHAYLLAWATGNTKFVQQYTSDAEDINKIFLFGKPFLYFLGISLGSFAQCVYGAVCMTQLLPLAVASANPGPWVVIVLIPLVFNFFTVRLCLFHAVLFRSFVSLDKRSVLAVYTTSMNVSATMSNIRSIVRNELSKKKITVSETRLVVCKMYSDFDDNGDFRLSQHEFRVFLGSLGVLLDDESFRTIWKAFDTDLSGYISWDEMYIAFFPEFRVSTHALAAVVDKFESFVASQPKGMSQSEILKKCFSQYDFDESGYISGLAFADMLDALDVGLPKVCFQAMLQSVASDGEKVTWDQFLDIVIHPCKRAHLNPKDFELASAVYHPNLNSLQSLQNLFDVIDDEDDVLDSDSVEGKEGSHPMRRKSSMFSKSWYDGVRAAAEKSMFTVKRHNSINQRHGEVHVDNSQLHIHKDLSYGDIYNQESIDDDDEDFFSHFAPSTTVKGDEFAV